MNPGSATKTPRTVTSEIRKFCDQLVGSGNLRRVRVKSAPEAAENDCFHNVSDHLKAHGGSSILGWTIWEWPATMIEAEFHCVWLSSKGDLIDITPKPDGDPEVLFLRDEAAEFDVTNPPPPRPNVRQPLTDHPAMRQFLSAATDREALIAQHWKGRHAEIPAAKMSAIERRLTLAVQALRARRVGRN